MPANDLSAVQTRRQHGGGEQDLDDVGGDERIEARAQRGRQADGAASANQASQVTPQAKMIARPAAIATTEVR